VPQFINVDLEALGRFVGRASNFPRWWVVVWVVVISAITVTAIICHAPAVVYLIVLALIALLFAGDRARERS
jgi:hypothetical protein